MHYKSHAALGTQFTCPTHRLTRTIIPPNALSKQ
jgi:hypothetical protein